MKIRSAVGIGVLILILEHLLPLPVQSFASMLAALFDALRSIFFAVIIETSLS